ncbi:MAG TPA: ATP-binding protein [Caulobacteraceae bacterium]|nr:ATP-binding protein [Caulobacteraceae bacterium]
MANLSLKGAGGFAIGVWVRAVLIGALAFGAIEAVAHHLYATALIVGGVAAVLGLEIARSADSADRMLAQFVSGLTAEGNERPTPSPGLRRLGGAIEHAFDRLGRARVQRQQRIDFVEALADNVLTALLVVDEAGSLVHANRAAHRLLGEAAGPLDRLPALGPQAARRLLGLASGGREIVRLADDRSVLASMNVFSIPGRPPLRLIALQSLSSDLDVVVLKSWQDLVRVLAHEMMNSLTPICSLSDSVAARLRDSAEDGVAPGEVSAEVAEAVEVIARRSAGLMNFVERYRKLAETPAAIRAPIAMGQFVGALERLMTPLMREAGVDYASEIEPANLVVQADRDLLEQATINLMKNAIDAVSGRPGAAIRLSCRLGDDDVAITIEDNGPGLAGDDAETAFVPFFTTKAGGSGIGLTLARQIALAHDGRIEHLRRAPSGAVFRLLLPRGLA